MDKTTPEDLRQPDVLFRTVYPDAGLDRPPAPGEPQRAIFLHKREPDRRKKRRGRALDGELSATLEVVTRESSQVYLAARKQPNDSTTEKPRNYQAINN